MDHAHAERNRVVRIGDFSGLAVDEDLAAVGGVEAVRDAHRGGLPRTVLAHNRMNRPGLDLDVDLVVRLHAAEALRDVPELDHYWNMASVTLISPAMIFFLAASAAAMASGDSNSLLYSSTV